MNNDYYEILNIPDTAPQASVTRSAQARLREISEDAEMTPEEKQTAIAAVNQAHETLSDAERRAEYDVHLQTWREEQARPKAKSKKKENISYPKVGLALAIVFAIGYFSITGYLGHQRQQENERKAVAAAEAQKLALEAEERARKAAVREAEVRALAEQKRAEQERMLNERGINTEKFLPPKK